MSWHEHTLNVKITSLTVQFGGFWFVFGLSCMTECWLDLKAFKTYMIFNRIMQIVNILFPHLEKSVAPRLLQLFRKLLRCCFSFPVKLQNILWTTKTSPDFPSASWVDNDWIFIEGRAVLLCFSPTLIQTDLAAVRFDLLHPKRLDLTWNQSKETFMSGLIKNPRTWQQPGRSLPSHIQ